jgi:hypothetical protein
MAIKETGTAGRREQPVNIGSTPDGKAWMLWDGECGF